MNNWKKERQTVSKCFSVKQSSFSIQETIAFLADGETQLKTLGFTKISWSYDSGYYDDGCQRSELKSLWVVGERLMTDLEQTAYEDKHRADLIESIKKKIKSIPPSILWEEKKLKDVTKNLERFQQELLSNPKRQKDIEDAQKALSRLNPYIVKLKEQLESQTPLLDLDDELLVFEYTKQVGENNLWR